MRLSGRLILWYFGVCLIWLLVFLYFSPVKAEIKIAVIDTGYDLGSNVRLCNGAKDYTTDRDMADRTGHGEIVNRLLTQNLPTPLAYCILPIKIFTKGHYTSPTTSADAINYAVEQGASIINMSFNGLQFSYVEQAAVRNALQKGVKLFIAAGNDSINLDKGCTSFPACYYKEAVVVGFEDIKFSSYKSNYGKVVDLILSGVDYETGRYGSSFATPKAINEYLINPSAFKNQFKYLDK